MSSKRSLSRRRLLSGMAAGATAAIIPRSVLGGPGQPSANNKLNIAGVGVGGMGTHDIRTAPSENIVAICDVDDNHAANAAKPFPTPRQRSTPISARCWRRKKTSTRSWWPRPTTTTPW